MLWSKIFSIHRIICRLTAHGGSILEALGSGVEEAFKLLIVPLKYIEYGVYGDLIIPKAIFYLLKGDYNIMMRLHSFA